MGWDCAAARRVRSAQSTAPPGDDESDTSGDHRDPAEYAVAREGQHGHDSQKNDMCIVRSDTPARRGAHPAGSAPAWLFTEIDAECGLGDDLACQERIGRMEATTTRVAKHALQCIATEHAAAAG
jgi:hypothetical protein